MNLLIGGDSASGWLCTPFMGQRELPMWHSPATAGPPSVRPQLRVLLIRSLPSSPFVFLSHLSLFISLFCHSIRHMISFSVLLSLSFWDLFTSCSPSDHHTDLIWLFPTVCASFLDFWWLFSLTLLTWFKIYTAWHNEVSRVICNT